MDLLIEKEGRRFTLSSLDLFVRDIEISAPKIETDRKSITGKNGKLNFGSVFSEKMVSVVCSYYAKNEYHSEQMKDKLNGVFADLKPFFITQMYSNTALYTYERPGEANSMEVDNKLYRYRFGVILDKIDFSFKGYSNAGLLFYVSFQFITDEIPFGQTMPVDDIITGKNFIIYKGTAACSQLEYPWYIELISDKAQGPSFSIRIGDQELKYESDKNILAGDVFHLKGVSFTKNELNINDQTNAQYFKLFPTLDNKIDFSCTLSGTVAIKNKIEFYA